MANVDGSAGAAPASEQRQRRHEAALRDDSDLDPAAFLKSVRELSEKREREDLQRFRKLEEEVQKGREERAARRAERARSISPQKQSTTSSPTSRNITRTNANASLLDSPLVTMTPSSSAAEPKSTTARSPAAMDADKTPSNDIDVPEFKGFGSIKRSSTVSSRASQSSAPAQDDSTATPTPSASNLARSGTLSWQQRPRPGSKLGSGRPQSMIVGGDKSASQARITSVDESEPSRDQIAASLGGRDPAWFRQTADRGIGNAAYRKSKEESLHGENAFSGRRGLPGMSTESSAGPERQENPRRSESMNSDLVSKGGSIRESPIANSSRYSATSIASNKLDLKSLLAADEDQQRASPNFDQASAASTNSSGANRALTMSNSQARLANATERPVSPTKGVGGFVQSAMMKRNDSQNKRWSAQPGASLSRTNSAASTRSGLGGLQGSHSMPKLEHTPASREINNGSLSRPASSSNNDLTSLSLESARDKDDFVKPALPQHSQSKSVASNYSANDDGSVPQPPGSPSKRWSPNKSSWIESSLTRSESPKPAPSRNSQPSWMADLAKAKAQRSTTELTAATTMTPSGETTPRPPSRPGSPDKSSALFGQGLLKRSESRDLPKTPGLSIATPSASNQELAPPKARTLDTTTDLESLEDQSHTTSSGAPITTSPGESNDAHAGLTANTHPDPPPAVETAVSKTPSISNTGAPATQELDPVNPKRSSALISRPPESGWKPETPPKPPTDFRNLLKSRPTSATKSKEEPEFLAKFGNLRKTQQEKYVAPDILKDNITRGKSGLTVTGGPVKVPRRDELKESLLAKKDDIRKAKEEGRDLPGQAHERKMSSSTPQLPSKPEALAKRDMLGRSDSAKSVQSAVQPVGETPPEALTRHKSLRQKSISEQAPKEIVTRPLSKPKLEPLGKATSATTTTTMADSKSEPLRKRIGEPNALSPKQPSETSKLASRFNPGLASLLARGPPSSTPSRPESPSIPQHSVSTPRSDAGGSPVAGEPLQDMRKDRAKGPKRRKGAAKAQTDTTTSSTLVSVDATPAPPSALDVAEPGQASKPATSPKPSASGTWNSLNKRRSPQNNSAVADTEANITNSREDANSPPTVKPKPAALPGSAASIMAASLGKAPRPTSVGAHNQEPDKTAASPSDTIPPPAKPKPQALPGSVASVMKASLSKYPQPDGGSQEEATPSTPTKSAVPTPGTVSFQESTASARSSSLFSSEKRDAEAIAQTTEVPEFKGFGSTRAQRSSQSFDGNKENGTESLPSVRAAASQWQRLPSPVKSEVPSQIQLPTKKDEEAAMRSAGLLASTSPEKNSGLGTSAGDADDKPLPTPPASANLPPKPAKSSRTVSGQLSEASPDKGFLNPLRNEPTTEAGRLLFTAFQTIPKYREPLAIDTSAVIMANVHDKELHNTKTLRKFVQIISSDGTAKSLPPQEEYTFFDESTYVCTHVYTTVKGTKASQVFAWSGESASESSMEAANAAARKLAKDNGSAQIHQLRQGQESAEFLEALGGIFVTRRGCRERAPKQFMLCGRKYLGHIVFDEVDFVLDWLCSGYVYFVSYPVTLQETKLYLWKGQGCDPEELSAARLAAMDLSETGEIIEVDGGVEFPSFLKVFGPNITKWSITKPTEMWQQKASLPHKFKSRLFRIQQAEARTGLFTSLWNRRPSWNNISPAREPEEVKVEAKEMPTITQAQLDADGIYLLDAFAELYVFIGPLVRTHPERMWNNLLGQALLFASDYATMSASMEDRPIIPKCHILFSTNVPRDVKLLFRHWDDSRGLWGTAGLMAGSSLGTPREVKPIPLDEMLTEVCRD